MVRIVSACLFASMSWLPLVSRAADVLAFDPALVPASAADPARFVPPGWTLEAQVAGDLNGDAVPDLALTLIEAGSASPADAAIRSRSRALVVVSGREPDGLHRRLAVTGRLLQCTGCGGAFYGVVDAPATVRIDRGVLIVEQDGGSRELVDTRYRFRWDRGSGRFALIGLDVDASDRATGATVSESTNLLTKRRVVVRAGGERPGTTETRITEARRWLDEVDGEALEVEAGERLEP